LWTEAEDPRDDEGELDWRVEHWRLLHGTGSPFDPAAFRALEERVIAHSGRSEPVVAHAYLDPHGLDRGAELARVTVPTLVVEASDDPVHPPPHSAHLAARIGRTGQRGRLVRIAGMGHAVSAAAAGPLASAVLAHTG